MTTTISSATTAHVYAPSTQPLPVPKTAAMANLAVSLSNDASLITGLSSAASASTPVYNAQGLMNNFQQAAAQNLVSSSVGAASTDTGTSSSAGSGASTQASDSTPTTNTDPTAFNGTPDWANVLKANPSLSGVFMADATNQLLVNQLSVFA